MKHPPPKKAEQLAKESYATWRGTHTFKNFAPSAWEHLDAGWRNSYVTVVRLTQDHERRRADGR